MANSDNKDGNDLIPNRTDNPVVPHPILPELPKFFAGQRLPKGARIIKGGDPILQYLNDSTLHNTIKLTQIVQSLRLELNLPGQDAPPLHSAGYYGYLL